MASTTEYCKLAINSLKYRHYFNIQTNDPVSKNISVSCTLCPGTRLLSTARNTTSNLKKHLENMHKHVELKEVKSEREKKLKRDELSHEVVKRPRFSFSKTTTIQDLKDVVTTYIIDDVKPLSTVESPAFKTMISSIASVCGAYVNIPNRKV